jgi:hypothetical protein
MPTLSVEQKSLTKAVSQWWRQWTRRGSARFELKCCGEEDYCPNAATLMALNALPWRARSEW